MMRLNIIAEGQTEETFVNKILGPHLNSFNVFVSVRCVKTGKKGGRIFRGGMGSYLKIKNDIEMWMKQDWAGDVRFTTMFDYYRLPNDFPGYEESRTKANPYDKIAIIEKEFSANIGSHRFIPYLQLHEYETLLFSDVNKFHHYYIDRKSQLKKLKLDIVEFTNPELINDKPETAPSKRIIKHLPFYEGEKPLAGPIIAEHIGLQKIRLECQHFNAWVSKLEALNS